MTKDRDTMKPERIQIRKLLAKIPRWDVTPDGRALQREIHLHANVAWAFLTFSLVWICPLKQCEISTKGLCVTVRLLPSEGQELTKKEIDYARLIEEIAKPCEMQVPKRTGS